MIVKQFRDEQLPLDMVVIDSDSKTKMVWTGYDWDLEQMPDPAGFFRWMKQQGIKVTVNEHYDPLTRDSDSHFDTIRQAMGLPADVKEIPHDIANQKYAGLFMDLLHKPDLERGLAFWWQDGAAGANMEGLDPYLWTRHIEYEGSERITGRRTTAFCRLGNCWGSHRYGIYFTGDLHGVWESLPVLIPATVRGGNQLTPYMNNLCAGVFVVDLPPELYQRWVQFSSFSPLIWFHGLWGLRLPWEYGAEGVENYRKFVGLRYALIPYIYTCSRVAHDTGLPLVRGMYLEYPDQEPAYTFQQQYLFGKDLLVAPITAPGEGKPVRKEVFLPAGQDWFDFFTGDFYAGGQNHRARVPAGPDAAVCPRRVHPADGARYGLQRPKARGPADAGGLCRTARGGVRALRGRRRVAGLPRGRVCPDAAAVQPGERQGITRCGSARPRASSRDSWPNAATRCRSTASASRTVSP